MIAANSDANITSVNWPYRDEETPLTGMLCRDEMVPGTRPGVLLVHGGAGLDEHARQQARRYAALGYVVFACDMLGDGVAGDRGRVIGRLTALRDDPPAMVRRAQAGLAALSRCPGVHGAAAVIGFCFGGLMDAARADWQLIVYGGALHGFTHANAASAGVPGVAYHPLADTRSFTAVRGFLADVFAPGEGQRHDTPD